MTLWKKVFGVVTILLLTSCATTTNTGARNPSSTAKAASIQTLDFANFGGFLADQWSDSPFARFRGKITLPNQPNEELNGYCEVTTELTNEEAFMRINSVQSHLKIANILIYKTKTNDLGPFDTVTRANFHQNGNIKMILDSKEQFSKKHGKLIVLSNDLITFSESNGEYGLPDLKIVSTIYKEKPTYLGFGPSETVVETENSFECLKLKRVE